MADPSADPTQLSPRAFFRFLDEQGVFASNPEAREQLRRMTEMGIHPLQLMRQREPEEAEQPRDPMLDTFDIDGFARYIAQHECRNVVVMCGAGVSTSAGIPDFRTPGTGLYDSLQRFNLSRPETIFEINYFRENPAPFYELCKDMWPGNYKPTPAHYFIRLLHEKGVLLRCYSQNIDSLECLAGLPSEKLVAAHGNFDAAHVIDTDPEEAVDIDELKSAIMRGEEGWQELRARKGNLVKPKIVFFGEELPQRFADMHQSDLSRCDLLIVMGTSLVVHPFAGLVGIANSAAPRLLINRDSAGTYEGLSRGFRFGLTEKGGNWRDVWYQGDCDAGCRALAKALGWDTELEALIASEGGASPAPVAWAGEARPEPKM